MQLGRRHQGARCCQVQVPLPCRAEAGGVHAVRVPTGLQLGRFSMDPPPATLHGPAQKQPAAAHPSALPCLPCVDTCRRL